MAISRVDMWAQELNNYFEPGSTVTKRQILQIWPDLGAMESVTYRLERIRALGLLRINVVRRLPAETKTQKHERVLEYYWKLHPRGRDVCLNCSAKPCFYEDRSVLPPEGCPAVAETRSVR